MAVCPGARLSVDDLRLNYGEDFPTWNDSFQRELRSGRSGLALLRGLPGTGKTSYIRHLIHRTAGQVRYYFVPVASFGLVSSPRWVEFWANEVQRAPGKPVVVILEDAEMLLADRQVTSNPHVGDVLNIADGLLGDLMQIKLICTVNCAHERLDPAVTRSGRLLAEREFLRIGSNRAAQIATRHNLTLAQQPDYSLAEIFNGGAKLIPKPYRPMGFGASLA